MLIERKKYIDKIKRGFRYNPIVILTGARQVGKTTLMRMYKVPDKTLFMHGQNPEIIDFFSQYALIEKRLKLSFGSQLKGLLLLDEFQYIHGISVILKLLVDHYPKLKILCSGSSSIDIEQQIEESLAGRIRTISVYPLSFSEYLYFTNKKIAKEYEKYSFKDNPAIFNRQLLLIMKDYILYGGLPKIALTEDIAEKIELLQDIYQTYLLRDVKSYVKNEDMIGFNKLLRLLSAQIGCEINVNELSISTGLSYKKCEEYLYLLAQMYIIKLIEPFLSNKRKEITKMRKVYFYDTGVRNIIYNSFNELDYRIDNGALFENFVLLQIFSNISPPEKINFYRTRNGLEIDFIISKTGKTYPVEVKFKTFEKPHKYRTFTEFEHIQTFNEGFIININCNGKDDNITYVTGTMCPKLFSNI